MHDANESRPPKSGRLFSLDIAVASPVRPQEAPTPSPHTKRATPQVPRLRHRIMKSPNKPTSRVQFLYSTLKPYSKKGYSRLTPVAGVDMSEILNMPCCHLCQPPRRHRFVMSRNHCNAKPLRADAEPIEDFSPPLARRLRQLASCVVMSGPWATHIDAERTGNRGGWAGLGLDNFPDKAKCEG
jgi:hypothetical protein